MPLRRERATGCPAAWLMKLVKPMRPEPRRMISATTPETQTRRVASSVPPEADLPQPLVDHPHSNFVRRLKSVSAFHFVAERQSAQESPRQLRQEQRTLPVMQLDLPAPVFCLRDRRPLIPSHVRPAIAPCPCFCLPTRSLPAPLRRHRALSSVFPYDYQRAFFHKCRRAARDQRSPQRSRRREGTTTKRRTRSRTACAIEVVRYRPFQFTSFKDSTRRGSRTGKSDVFPTILK